MSRQPAPIGMTKLQKLLYFSQGWSLALTGDRLHSSETEAWTNGPVVRSVYSLIDVNSREHYVDRLPHDSAAHGLLSLVQAEYGGMSGNVLSVLTHAGGPWNQARAGLPGDARSQALISTESMASYFSEKDSLAGLRINEILYMGLESFDPRIPLPEEPHGDHEALWETNPLLDESANLFAIPPTHG
ncbi:type II toxin-antitoxin system antitoxin SocA domain-containing protein [Corynebacterium mastitidis]|uniref:Type II toxin-antitoxin system antitoxin SocA domain-containing protein n=1 Tax=Corynebacterium mastitidis TaxID=161890 RepID=A0ABU8NZX2_9CORY